MLLTALGTFFAVNGFRPREGCELLPVAFCCFLFSLPVFVPVRGVNCFIKTIQQTESESLPVLFVLLNLYSFYQINIQKSSAISIKNKSFSPQFLTAGGANPFFVGMEVAEKNELRTISYCSAAWIFIETEILCGSGTTAKKEPPGLRSWGFRCWLTVEYIVALASV